MDYETLRDPETSLQVEAEFLRALVRAIKPTVCLETGTHKGYSAIHIAEALWLNGKGHLHTYDITDYGQEKNIADAGFSEQVTVNIGDSMGLQLAGIDFAFIDGNHDNDFVYKEFKNLLPQLNHGAIVIFHDHSVKSLSCVSQAIHDLGINVIFIPTHYGMGIYRHD